MQKLKIEDNVNLKELEKFGFTESNVFTYVKFVRKITYEIDWNRIININTAGSMLQELDDTIYDLIQAGIVETVIEKKENKK